MSEEDFLKRWSRRKREVAAAETAAPPAPGASPIEKPIEDKDAREVADESAEARAKIEATLPPVESITELSDITAFLKAGVPADLTRAALRRVWTVDPSIRDFIGVAENSWDFTDPTAMPGFGPLEDTEEVRRMIARIVDEIGQAPKPATADIATTPENSNYSNVIKDEDGELGESDLSDQSKISAAQNVGSEVLLHSDEENIALQHNAAEAEEAPKQIVRRGHGRALPQ